MDNKTDAPLPDLRIREARIRKKLTQQMLADMVGMDRKQIIWIENRKSSPNLSSCLKICECLGCTLSELFDDVADSVKGENEHVRNKYGKSPDA